MSENGNFDFEVIVDESLLDIDVENEIKPNENKHLLSIINDFENGSWRLGKFSAFVWDNIAEVALSTRERNALVGKPRSTLREAAIKLKLTDRDTQDQGSELAEVVLYGIMKKHYSGLSVVPKIFYKQNRNDYAKGADSVHIVINNDTFSLWLGEAKFYDSIDSSRLSAVISSIQNLLEPEKLKKENSIITNTSDINDLKELPETIKNDILSILDQKASIDDLKPKLNIPILLLHECQITKQATELSQNYKDEIIKFHHDKVKEFFKKQVKKISSIHKYSQIKFHLILFPVHEKSLIVDKFVKNIKHYQEEE